MIKAPEFKIMTIRYDQYSFCLINHSLLARLNLAGGQRAGSGIISFPFPAEPACRPLAFSIVLTDREPGTGLVNRDQVEGVGEFLVDSCPWSGLK